MQHMLKKIRSRAGRYAVIETIHNQLQSQNKMLTAYSFSSAIGSSVNTARRILNSAVADGMLTMRVDHFRSNVSRHVYSVSQPMLTADQQTEISHMMILYWRGRLSCSQ